MLSTVHFTFWHPCSIWWSILFFLVTSKMKKTILIFFSMNSNLSQCSKVLIVSSTSTYIKSILLDVKEGKLASTHCELSVLNMVKFFLVLADWGRGGVTHPLLATPKRCTALSTKIQFSPRREKQICVISMCLCVCAWGSRLFVVSECLIGVDACKLCF